MLIEVAETYPPAFGKKVAKVIAAGGEEFEIWPEKLASLQVGARYDVDVAEREFNGRTIRKITKARPATAAPSNGHAAHSVAASGEAEFVGAVLAGLIAAGHVRYDKKELFDATNVLRGLWCATFGVRRNGVPA